jgi:uncharacterized integral membrane protein
MGVIKAMFWLLVAGVMLVLFLLNPARVDFVLPGVPVLNARLGFLLVLAFLAGMIPMYWWHKLRAWALKRKLRKVEASVAASAPSASTPAVDDPAATLDRRMRAAGYAGDVPVQARPIAVPPAGA